MKKRINIPILIIFAVFFVASLAFPVKSTAQYRSGYYYQPQVLPTVKATLANTELDIMLARTYLQKQQGFMFYEEIANNTGMLFVYNQDHLMHFWMKNTIVPLDLVFLSSELKVVEWIENMKPGFGKPENTLPHYSSTQPARYALELKAGMVKKLGIKIGDKLEIPLIMLYSE